MYHPGVVITVLRPVSFTFVPVTVVTFPVTFVFFYFLKFPTELKFATNQVCAAMKEGDFRGADSEA